MRNGSTFRSCCVRKRRFHASVKAGGTPTRPTVVVADPWPLFRTLRRRLFGRPDHGIQNPLEFFQTRGGNDDRVPPSTHVLGDAQKSAARVFLARNNKGLPLHLNLVSLECFFVYREIWLRRVSVC